MFCLFNNILFPVESFVSFSLPPTTDNNLKVEGLLILMEAKLTFMFPSLTFPPSS